MKSTIAFMAGLVVALGAGADVANSNGLFQASTTDELTAVAGDGALELGHGMFKWDGTGAATWANGLTLSATNNLEVTVNVSDPDATLTVNGAVSQADNGAFIKSGPGTLELTGGGRLGKNAPWSTGYWKAQGKTEGVFCGVNTAWDDYGHVTNGGHTGFTVAEGTLRLNAPGQTFTLAVLPWVGNRLQYSPRLEVTNNTTVTTDGSWCTIGRGTGQTSNDAAPEIAVTDGGNLSLWGLCYGNAIGTANYFTRSRLLVDNASVTVGGYVFMPEHNGEVTLTVTNRGIFSVTAGPLVDNGYRTISGTAHIDVSHSATSRTQQIGFNANTDISVRDGGVFKLDRMIPSYYNASGVRTKKVLFDGGTLAPYSTSTLAEWFGGLGTGVTNLQVGVAGMTLDVPAHAWLCTVPKAADGAAASASLTKTGAGTLYLKPSTNALPVVWQEGGIGFTTPWHLWTNGYDNVWTPSPGTYATVAGEGALGDSVLAPAGDFTLNMLGKGHDSGFDMTTWKCNKWTKILPDGTLQLTTRGADSFGSAWRSQKVRVDESFTVSFDAFTWYTTSSYGWGWLLAFQNLSTSACGSGGANFAFNYGSMTNSGANAWGEGLDLQNLKFLDGRGGKSIVQATAPLRMSAAQLAASSEAPCHCVFTYDADAHEATLTITQPGSGVVASHTVSVDLATYLGSSTAYVGFTGATTSGASAEHCMRNFRFVPGTSSSVPDLVRTGGKVRLGSGAAMTANLVANESIGTFALDSLEASGAVTLDVGDSSASLVTHTLPELSTLNHDAWQLAGRAFWTDTGLASSTNASGASGGAITKHAYPATGTWNLAFDWSPGTPVPANIADVYMVSISHATAASASVPSTGITLWLQDWDNSIHKNVVYVKLYVKGVAHSTQYYSTNTAESVTLNMRKDLHVNMAYDDVAKSITLDLTQDDGATAKRLVFTGVDMDDALGGADTARLAVYSKVGGHQTQAIMSNLEWTGEAMAAGVKASKHRPALAFDNVSGATAITKTGDGDLAFLKPDALDASVTLAKGGLRFAKEPLETVTVGAGGGWIFNKSTGVYTATNGVKIGTNATNNRDSSNLRHRVRVSGDWRATFTLWNTVGADAISLYFHNDPRGNNVVGANNQSAGYVGVQNSCGIGWYTFTSAAYTNRIAVSQNGAGFGFSANGVLMTPVAIRTAKPIETTFEYDGDLKSLTVTMVQDGNEFTHTWDNFDIKASVKDDYAYIAVGSGGGGLHTLPYFDNFRFEQLDGEDTLAEEPYLGSVDVTASTGYMTLDSPVSGGTFEVADSVSVAAGSTLHVVAADQDATLHTGTLTLGAGASLAGDAEATIAPDAVTGSFTDLVVDGAVFAPSAADIAAGTFAKRTVRLNNGAKLHIAPAAFMRVEDVYVDGVRQDASSVYTALSADWITSTSLGRVGMRAGTMLILR